jgi:transposase-like protein/transposase
MAPRSEVVLSDEEREVIERWTRHPKSALALRCRIVLAVADGGSSKEIAAQLGCDRSTVGRWRRRFAERGLEGLHDEPRLGKPRSTSDHDVERGVATTLEEQPPHIRSGTISLPPALDHTPAQVIGSRHRAEKFRRLLNAIRRVVAEHLDVHVVLDNSSTQKTPATQRWVVRQPPVTLHVGPTYRSWLNLVQRWSAKLTTKGIKRGARRFGARPHRLDPHRDHQLEPRPQAYV